MQSAPKTVIGWVEHVRFPKWEIGGVKAKVDTGARTSALHVENLRIVGGDKIEFEVAIGRRKPFAYKTIVTPFLRRARVRSSTGEYQMRYFIMADIQLGPVVKSIEVSLVSRKEMLFRMLLGRKALQHDFWVDVSRRNLISERPRKRKWKTTS